MKKKIGIPLYLILAYILFISSCSPTIRFDIDGPPQQLKNVYLQPIDDKRPVNERVGYKIFYVDSIADDDYPQGFVAEFRKGLEDGLEEYFMLVDKESEADVVLHVSVNHFYGEYSQTVKTVLWEWGTALLLFIPRLVTDAIPYNTFAGRVAFDLTFSNKTQKAISRSIDINVTDSVTTYKRGSADTASRLSDAASLKLNTILQEVIHEI